MKACKIEHLKELKPVDLPQRYNFSIWALGNIAEDTLYPTKILFSDEAHFWLNSYVNKQNCRIWGEEQPNAVQELSLHPLKTSPCCDLWAGRIIGADFFKNEASANVTVNGDRYRAMITDCLLPEIEARNFDDIWFQQDGATSHRARETMDLMRNCFDSQFISRLGTGVGHQDRHTFRVFSLGLRKV